MCSFQGSKKFNFKHFHSSLSFIVSTMALLSSLVIFIVVSFISTSSSATKYLTIGLDTKVFEEITQDVERTVFYDVTLVKRPPVDCQFKIKFTTQTTEPRNQIVVEIVYNATVLFRSKSLETNSSKLFSFAIKSKFFGFYLIKANIEQICKGDSTKYDQTWHDLRVIRKLSMFCACLFIKLYSNLFCFADGWDTFVQVLIAMLVIVNHVNMGCQLDMLIIKEQLRRPIGPVIGFVCQFVIMPLVSSHLECTE